MIFHASVKTLLDTKKTTPKETPFKVVKGLIYKVTVYFPPGPSGLTGVQVYDANYQLYPTTVDEWFIGDNLLLEFEDTYFKDTEPFNLILKTYNIDDSFDHTIYVMVGMVSEKMFMARYVPTVQYEMMKQIFSEIAEEQREIKRQLIKNPFPIG